MVTGQALLERKRGSLPPAPRPIGDLVSGALKVAPPPALPTAARVARASLDDLDLSNERLRGIVAHLRREWPPALRREPGTSVILAGPVGTGKTHVARALFHAVARQVEGGDLRAPTGRFYHETDLLMAFQPTQNEHGLVEIPRPAAVFGAAPLLVIDDAGSGQTLPFIKADDQVAERQARFFRVVDWAYTAHVALVLTSNLSISALPGFFGHRTWDRLQEMTRKFVYDFTGIQSWRKR